MQAIRPSLRVGNPVIDEEHRFLVNRLEYLLNHRQTPLDTESFFSVFSELGTEIGLHFSNEEGIFKSLNMPTNEVEKHVQAHSDILDQYVQLNLDLMHGKSFSHLEILRMLHEWVISHIIDYDLLIRRYLPASA